MNSASICIQRTISEKLFQACVKLVGEMEADRNLRETSPEYKASHYLSLSSSLFLELRATSLPVESH